MGRGVIYGLFDETGLRYVGQTTQDVNLRFKQHLWHSSKLKSYLGSWLRSLVTEPSLEVIEECDHESLDSRELAWISEFRLLGCNLVNSMVDHPNGGHHTHSEETKKKIGEATKMIHTGLKRSEETKRRISESLKGKTLGRKRPKEVIEKIAKANKGKVCSKEHKAKISSANKGRKRTDEFKARCSKIKTKEVLLYNVSLKTTERSTTADIAKMFNVTSSSINSRLTKYYGRLWKEEYILVYSESELKRVLKQIGYGE